ncbi:hypothetical protein BH20ACT3_BH20ACT3_16200 [soil metagenome]
MTGAIAPQRVVVDPPVASRPTSLILDPWISAGLRNAESDVDDQRGSRIVAERLAV